MLTITPIGSCRIATPLRLCRQTHGFEMNMGGIYGYSHSSAEAVQQMQYLQGDYVPLPALWPLISPRWEAESRNATPHRPSDIYIVELCSAKVVTVGSQCIQLNYMRRHFADFFADQARTRTFHILATDPDHARLGEWLQDIWFTGPDRQAETAILRHVRIDIATTDTICADMARLRDGLGNVLFVTHVNACGADGAVLSGRAAYIDQVTQAAAAANVPLYNPTDLMRRFGQEAAIADHSTSLAHFTDNFSRAVLDDWYAGHLQDMIEGLVLDHPADAIGRIIVPHARAFLATGCAARIADIANLLDAVEGYFPHNIALKQVKCDLALAAGQGEGVKRALFQLALSADLSRIAGLAAALDQYDPDRIWVAELLAAPHLHAGARVWLDKQAAIALRGGVS